MAQRSGQSLVTDAKALFDALQKEASGSKQDRRAAVCVDLSIIQESMVRTGAEVKWVPHGRMLADPLTKIKAYAASPALDDTITSGIYKFVTEEIELQERSNDASRKNRSRTAILRQLLSGAAEPAANTEQRERTKSRKPQGEGTE
eukprot:4589848-Amphidinium_carterae.1